MRTFSGLDVCSSVAFGVGFVCVVCLSMALGARIRLASQDMSTAGGQFVSLTLSKTLPSNVSMISLEVRYSNGEFAF